MLRRAASPPPALDYLYARFLRLAGMREYDMNGPRRLTPLQILGGCELFGWTLTPLEAEAIVALDVAQLYPDPPEG